MSKRSAFTVILIILSFFMLLVATIKIKYYVLLEESLNIRFPDVPVGIFFPELIFILIFVAGFAGMMVAAFRLVEKRFPK